MIDMFGKDVLLFLKKKTLKYVDNETIPIAINSEGLAGGRKRAFISLPWVTTRPIIVCTTRKRKSHSVPGCTNEKLSVARPSS